MVNFIKEKSLHLRMFKRVCKNLDEEHMNLFLHAKIWWLSRGGVINMVFELIDELQKYLQETNKQDFAKCFEVEHWLHRSILQAFFVT